jgi:cysteine desulfurase
VYLDAASGERLHPAARAALLATVDQGWADPGRLYGAARRARLLLDAARETVAGVLGARPDEVSFPASGTAAAHLAVLGGLAARARAGRLLVTTAVEHSSVLAAAEVHETSGGLVTRVAVDRHGRVDLDAFQAALGGPGTALASVQSANHEVGTSQPLGEVARACLRSGVPLHVDAAQSVGRVPVRCDELGPALLSASAHKWGGPAGVGVLVVRAGTRWRSPMPVDEREHRRVAGFENVPAVVAAAAALAARREEMAREGPRLGGLTQRLREEVPRRIRDVAVIGDPDPAGRLPHIVTFSFLYVDGEALLGELDRAGIAASSGSSCAAGTVAPSHVLEAMGVLTHGNLRISLGRDTTERDVALLLEVLPAAVERLRAQAGVASL